MFTIKLFGWEIEFPNPWLRTEAGKRFTVIFLTAAIFAVGFAGARLGTATAIWWMIIIVVSYFGIVLLLGWLDGWIKKIVAEDGSEPTQQMDSNIEDDEDPLGFGHRR